MNDFFYRQLAKAAGLESVEVGREVSVKVDLALAHDGTGPEILKHADTDSARRYCGCRTIITLDHCFPAPTVNDREFQRAISAFASRNGAVRLYKNGEGVLHQVVSEEESLWPGMIIAGADGHVATAGALSAIAFSVTPKVFLEVLETGILTIKTPGQLIISVEGSVPSNVFARDIAMHIIAGFGEELKDRALLFTGSVIDSMSVSEKMSLCNFMPEGGATTALILPEGEKKTVDLRVDGEEITPMIALPPGLTRAFSRPEDVAGKTITMAIAGGCSSGRLEDMKIMSDILTNKEVHPDVTFIVTPGSKNVMDAMDKLRISSVLRNAGAIIMVPGCGPCPGKHFGLLCDDDVAVTTTIRNNPGRIGAEKAQVYLASAATVAWSAVRGHIVEPVIIKER